jgi:hypothetical protein
VPEHRPDCDACFGCDLFGGRLRTVLGERLGRCGQDRHTVPLCICPQFAWHPLLLARPES